MVLRKAVPIIGKFVKKIIAKQLLNLNEHYCYYYIILCSASDTGRFMRVLNENGFSNAKFSKFRG